jgi:hypothetical protein
LAYQHDNIRSTLTIIKGALKLMGWTKAKTALVMGAAAMLAAGTTVAVIDATGGSEAPKSLTLKVDPDVFTKNIKARAGETMHLASDSWGEILLEVLAIEGVDCTPPHGIAFNNKTGEISMQNGPQALEAFRRVVGELNRPDGERSLPSPDAPPSPVVLITSAFYRMSSSEFEGLGLGKPAFPGAPSESPWWILKPGPAGETKRRLQTMGLQPLQSPRIQTSYGCAASLLVGDAAQSISWQCLPMPGASRDEQELKLKVQAGTTGKFTGNPRGDWPEFAGRTNCAIFARVLLTPQEGFSVVFRAENPDKSAANNLVILLETQPVVAQPSVR